MGALYRHVLFRGARVPHSIFLVIPALIFLSCIAGTAAKAQTIKGKVYRDFNADGLKTIIGSFSEIGAGNVLVCAYKKDGTLADSTRTANDGTYTIHNAPLSDTLRIEFKDFMESDYDGPYNPIGSKTSVQFAAGNSVGVDLGINYPNHYCETQNPQTVTTCYVAVNAATTSVGYRDVLVGVPYEGIDSTKKISPYAFVKDLGSVWGVAYKRETAQVFTSAFTKRHVGFTAKGPGAIFVTSISSTDTSTTEFFNFGAIAGVDMHTDLPDDITPNARLDSYDIPAYDAVGTTSLGGLDISEDGKTLWVINLKNRKLYSLDIATKDTVSYIIPNPCNGKSYRPFATKYYRNKVYIGVVCTREDALEKNDSTGLAATVYAFKEGTFTQVLHFPLTYIKGASNADIPPIGDARAQRWRPWIPLPYFEPDRNNNFKTYPQAWLTDIEFDVDGSMIVGLRDRFGDQMGFENRLPIANEPDLYTVIGPGEVLRAGPCGPNGTWLIENGGSVCGSTTSAEQTNAAGIGGGKYYWGERTQNGANHEISTQAGLALLAGSGKLAMTAINPTELQNTGGIKRLINSNGERDGDAFGEDPNPNGGVVLYRNDVYGYGKANGLGGLEILCAPQPIEIGNRIWNDKNRNGRQDANEIGIDGVTVTLCDAMGNSLASVQTGNGGQYYFSSATTTGGPAYIKYQANLKFNTKYILKISNFAAQSSLAGLLPTIANSTSDHIDSDFEPTGANLTFTFTTGTAGQNNFKADAGFAPKLGSLGDFVWKDLNNNGRQDAGEPGIPGVVVQLLNSIGTVLATDTTNSNGLYTFDSLSNGTYRVKILTASLPSGLILSTVQNAAGVPDSLDSDFDPITGLSQFIVIDVTQTGINKDNPTLDGGVFIVCNKPNWVLSSSPVCSPNAAVYSLTLSVVNQNGFIKVNAGTVSGSNPYTITDIPHNVNLVITDSVTAFCKFDTTFTAPDCDCAQLSIITPNATVCKGSPFPILKATVIGPNVTGAGVIWYDAPTGGNVLATTLNFQPVGIAAVTDTFYVVLSGLTPLCTSVIRTPVIVTVQNCEVDLALKKRISSKIANIGDTLIYTIKVWNEFTNKANGVEVTDSIPAGIQFIPGSFTSSRGLASISNNVIQWNIGSVAANGDTVTLTYKSKVMQAGIHYNTAEISRTNEKDRDSTPGNGKDNEDDKDVQCFTVPIKLCTGEKVQLNVPANYTNVKWFKTGSPTPIAQGNEVLLTQTGVYTFTALNATCPAGGCCPIIIVPGTNCCPENLCIPFVIRKTKKAGKSI
ncbi:SdrD B-like domain-containing protein [Runella slithyformis]|uniref:Conserved repeat domain protein n=1 Tax=Runella slithyformis (strain ATCC 29530 / DSM 19594 / LMG 11500 / NCIMB 11436 / LSU 4) TaxID=761193 RepID=A0A7U3ZKA0_RUNSL|nr:SdrD B-like domain-containing protein [Runella slithyformis]AEI48781.1 conserved repeat domain protein [Runella slithyformis DSM 19594]